MSLVLLIGGTRSGKSEVAEALAQEVGAPVVYVATASAADEEMAERIARHRARRPLGWRTNEALDPASALAETDGATVLVDGIGGWVAELMRAEGLWSDEDVARLGREGEAARTRIIDRAGCFAEAAAGRRALTLVVAEECGLGMVATGAGARRFVDLTGEITQVLARHAERVRLVVAGCPIDIKADPGVAVPSDLRVHGDAMVPPGALDFAVSVVAGGPPQWLRAELAAALRDASAYPDEGAAVRALADRHGRAPAEILPVNGSAEAFWLIATALRPARAVVVHPAFTEPEVALRALGRRVERVFRDPDSFSLDPNAIPPEADLVFVCNPNNPTGTLDEAATLERLARPRRVLVVDEAFMEFCPGEPKSLANHGHMPGLIVLRSLTKIWSLPGIRAGYAMGAPELIAKMRALRQPWSVNTLALVALTACARDEATPRKIAEEIGAGREELAAALGGLPGVRVWPSAANFLLVRVPDGPEVRAALLARGIAVRRADTFPGLTEDHIRISVRNREENNVLTKALREMLR